jgi:hypothetical protein
MIVRILSEGQFELSGEAVRRLNEFDVAVEQAVSSDDQAQLQEALSDLLDQVRQTGERLADDDLRDSDLILPDEDATVADVQALLSESEEGLIPN